MAANLLHAYEAQVRDKELLPREDVFIQLPSVIQTTYHMICRETMNSVARRTIIASWVSARCRPTRVDDQLVAQPVVLKQCEYGLNYWIVVPDIEDRSSLDALL